MRSFPFPRRHPVKVHSWVVLVSLGLVLGAATSAQAAPFNLLVPKRVQIASGDPDGSTRVTGSGNWGGVVATKHTIPSQLLRNATATATFSNPQVTTNSIRLSSSFPSLGLKRIGGTGTSTNLPHPLFVPLIQSDEQIDPNIMGAYVVGFRFPSGTTGTVTMNTTLRIGEHFARYETVLEFESRPGFGVEMVEAQRVSAVPLVFEPNLDPDLFKVKLPTPPYDPAECTEPKPEGTCSGVLCKPCNMFICQGSEWVLLEMDWPDILCRQRSVSEKAWKARRNKHTICPRTDVGLCPQECDLCF